MQPSGCSAARVTEGGLGGFGRGPVPDPYDSFMRGHLRYYGYFRGQKAGGQKSPMSLGVLSEQHPTEAPGTGSTDPGYLRGPRQELSPPGVLEPAPSARRRGTPLPSARHRGSPGEPPALFALPSARGPLPAPRWPIECEVIEETIEHIEWVPPEPEPFCQPMAPDCAPAALGEEHGTIVYHLSPAPRGSCFTRARIGGAPGPLSSPAAPLEGPQDTTLLFESRFESGNLQKAVKVGPYEYVLTLRPDLYTAKHTQWFYFRVQNTRQGPLYRFTITNLAKPKSLYGEGMRPLFYSQRDAQSRGIGWRRVGADVRYYRGGGGEEPAAFRLSWTARFPHNGDTCFFAHSYPYTYSDLQRYLRALAGDPVRSRYCVVRALCRSLAGNTVYLLTITSPAGAAAKRAVVLSARVHPGESGGSWAMRGFLDFLLSADADAQLLRRLFVFKVVPMLNPDGVVVGNSRCSLAGRDPNRAYGTALCGSFPGVWHLRAMVERVLAEREVVLYCDFHGHSRKNNVFMYGCDGGGAGAGLRLCQRVFPLMLSKNAPDKFSFPSCKFKVQKSKAGTGRVIMWRMGVSNSYTMEAAFGGSTLGGRSSHFTVEDLKSLGYHLCDTLLDFCDPDPAKVGQQLRLKPRHPGRFRRHRWVAVTLAPSHSSSSACRRWTRCCGSGWAGSRALAAAGVTSPLRNWSPGTSQPCRPVELRWCRRGLQAVVSPTQHQRLRQLRVRRVPGSPPWPGPAAGAREEEAAAEPESEECPAPDKCCLPEPCQRPGQAGALQDPQAAGSPRHPEGRQRGGRGAQSRLRHDLSQRSQSRGWPPRHHGGISAGWWHRRGVTPSAAAEHPSPRCHR
ncbi:cytosolic carboxypeptidase 2 isoform X4 [Aquila chrysaetos chrysaetos]|uniref:cytosolic carboxypeptidase 2 isoform X4 n=1 Tax=Aquila chrysaetos chrysaetos TaxID=223781 RepID=UPI001B7D3687|nr:cytosolic carboxypeptidase 2 isoform X4 [Aquila chrysaetos chrysaetos]